jgi:hypothetical protein
MPYKLFVLPTPDTKALLHTMFADVPVVIDYDKLCVEIGSSTEAVVPDLTRMYRALPGQIGIWYETAVGYSSILLPLIPSPEMCARRVEVGDVWDREFVPFMALTSRFNNGPNVKPKLNSISTSLVDHLPELRFTCETVLYDEAEVPSQLDFYEDYLKSKVNERPTFLELTNP